MAEKGRPSITHSILCITRLEDKIALIFHIWNLHKNLCRSIYIFLEQEYIQLIPCVSTFNKKIWNVTIS